MRTRLWIPEAGSISGGRYAKRPCLLCLKERTSLARPLASAKVESRMRVWIASPLIQPSPNGRRVGIRIVTFEACSGFTHVTARRIAQPPKAAFVTRLQPLRLPARAARQLPDQSTTLRVESSSTDDSRLRDALPEMNNPPFHWWIARATVDL